MILQGNNRYSAIVVVTRNSLGIPGLMTGEDKIYNVSCDYSSQAMKKVEAKGRLGVSAR